MLGLLYQIIYAYTFVGFSVLVLILPLNGIALKGMNEARGEMVKKTDVRTRLLNEVMQAIKVVRNVLSYPRPPRLCLFVCVSLFTSTLF